MVINQSGVLQRQGETETPSEFSQFGKMLKENGSISHNQLGMCEEYFTAQAAAGWVEVSLEIFIRILF